MAIKQRALRKLNTTTNHMLRAMSTESKAAVGGVCHDLEELRDLYREGLPQQDYAIYGEICDGLLLAVQKMMEDGAADVSGDATALCKELLEYLGTETEKETHFKKEIVFLPYQASMWDSLESVWKAAYEDKEHCNAYVIPIPYADLNPDRSVAAWHCERDQFPKYVPTLDWQEIDLKAWHPDAIFYHNPYDDCNLVTSVESRYYSRNLKECADKLVYIPYFVLEEPCTEESVEHFVTTPGVLNADQVIVQSEAMRELYINILTKRTNHTDRSFWEKRISGAGSPKIEKVLTSKKEDFDMPEKWRKLVEGKKVILYNTSLSAMLQNSDKVCDKLRYVFDVFRNRDDVVLWWRPHPLMKSTFRSMRPQFEEDYLSLEKQYIEDGWGIYDDSPDLHRAICWSDAYYGDMSSVVYLCREAGIPVMIQDVALRRNRLPYMLYVFSVKDEVWFIGNEGTWQGLFLFNLQTGVLHYKGELPSHHQAISEYVALGRIGEKIIIAPYFSRDGFLEYDLETSRYHVIDVQYDTFSEKSVRIAFANSVRYGRSIFFLPNFGYPIIEYRGETGTYHQHKLWEKVLPDNFPKDKIIIGRHCWQLIESVLYFVLAETNLLIELDLENMNVVLHKIPILKRAWNLYFQKNKCWITPVDNEPFICWDIEADRYEIIDNRNLIKADVGIYGLTTCDKHIVTIPYKSAFPCIIYPVAEQNNPDAVVPCSFLGDCGEEWKVGSSFSFVSTPNAEGRCFAFEIKTGYLGKFDKEGNGLEENYSEIQVSVDDAQRICEDIIRFLNMVNETSFVAIENFLRTIRKNEKSNRNKSLVNNGFCIYKSLFCSRDASNDTVL